MHAQYNEPRKVADPFCDDIVVPNDYECMQASFTQGGKDEIFIHN
jgi:hypothetical protein